MKPLRVYRRTLLIAGAGRRLHCAMVSPIVAVVPCVRAAGESTKAHRAGSCYRTAQAGNFDPATIVESDALSPKALVALAGDLCGRRLACSTQAVARKSEQQWNRRFRAAWYHFMRALLGKSVARTDLRRNDRRRSVQ